MVWMALVPAILQLLPSVVKVVSELTKDVENEVGGGNGEAKKAAVVGMVKAGMNAADQVAEDGELINPQEKQAIELLAGEAVDVLVGLQNTVGVFKKIAP